MLDGALMRFMSEPGRSGLPRSVTVWFEPHDDSRTANTTDATAFMMRPQFLVDRIMANVSDFRRCSSDLNQPSRGHSTDRTSILQKNCPDDLIVKLQSAGGCMGMRVLQIRSATGGRRDGLHPTGGKTHGVSAGALSSKAILSVANVSAKTTVRAIRSRRLDCRQAAASFSRLATLAMVGREAPVASSICVYVRPAFSIDPIRLFLFIFSPRPRYRPSSFAFA